MNKRSFHCCNDTNRLVKDYGLSFSLILLLFTVNGLPAQHPDGSSSGKRISFIQHPVDLNIPGIHDVKIFDLDGDGDFDIVGGSEQTPYSSSVGIVWWRNEGGSPIGWTKFVIDDSFLHVMSVDVGYINEDMFPDILASSWSNGRLMWWKNSGNPETGWVSFDIVSGWTNPHDGVCHDIDGDGKTDIIGVSAGNHKISVFSNMSGINPLWQENVITSDFGGAKSVIVADLDNDSLPDLVGAGDGCDEIAWWKNPGGGPAPWQKQVIATYFNGSNSLDVEEMNNDNRLDIIGSGWEGNEVSYWCCTDIISNNWQKTMVTNQLPVVVNAIGRDFDLDGDKDIIAVGKVPGELVIYIHGESGFEKEVLYPDFSGGSALAVFDMDQDGDDDIIAGAGILKQLYLYENETIVAVPPSRFLVSSRVSIIPNPSDGLFTVRMPEVITTKARLIISSIRSVQLFEQFFFPTTCEIRVNIPVLENGFYFLNLFTDHHLYQGKLVINRRSKP